MTPGDAQLTNALRLLRMRGFEPAGNRAGTRSFEGDLTCRGGNVRVRLSITDWDFLRYPSIIVLDGTDGFPPLVPHLTAEGWLCYFAAGSVVLDRYNPAEALAQCLDQAKLVLEQIRFDADYRRGDIQDEFMVHWLNGQSTAIWDVLIGTVALGATCTNYWLVDINGVPTALIADSEKEVAAFAGALGASAPEKTTCPCWLFQTDVLPVVPDVMPSTVKALFAWLKAWDKGISNGVQRILEKEPRYLKYKQATFAVKTPIGWLGFGFDLDQIQRLGAIKKPRLYKQHLHGKGGTRGIMRLSISEFGPAFVHSRNLTFKDLSGRQIKVVGCGAIGSYVALSLVRLGAGANGGKLTLIDPDKLKPENIGRHVLGYPALFKSKATALRDELVRQFPFSTIDACPTDVRGVPALFSADLVIDATGEESVSEFLNARRIAEATKTPLLHAWIKGNGQTVQTLWVQGSKGGCFRCLRLADHKNYREERFKVLKEDPVRRLIGCTGFTPYGVAAPMHAATLATETILDWLQRDSPSPRFRTRSVASADVFEVKNQDLTRLAACPACGTNDVAIPAVR